MSHTLINYADGQFYRAQTLNTYTGLKYAGFNHTISYRRKHLDAKFVDTHKGLLAIKRGAGLWLWKPYIILQTLRQAKRGDVIIYSDSGAVFLQSIEPLISACRGSSAGVLACDLNELLEYQWSKRDAFVMMGCDHPEFHNSAQMMAGLLLFVKNPLSELFVEQWLQYAVHPQLLSDNKSICGLPELSGFRQHRHDQSIFSLLYKKWRLQSYQSISGQGIDQRYRSTRREPSFSSILPAYFYLPHYWRRKSYRQFKHYPLRQNQQQGDKMSNQYDPNLALLQAQQLMSENQFCRASDLFNSLHEYLESSLNSAHAIADTPEFLATVYEHRAICYFRQQLFIDAEQNYQLAAHYQPDKQEYKIKQQLCHNLSRQTAINTIPPKLVLILLFNGFPGAIPSCGNCPVRFEVTTDRHQQDQADIVIYHIPGLTKQLSIPSRPGQISVASSMECEVLYPLLADTAFMSQFDVTMTYRQDADIWCSYLHDDIVAEITQTPRPKTAVAPIACFISNGAQTDYDREAYLSELMRHIAVDSYGSTLTNKVLAEDNGRATKLDVCANYAFTLAFENSRSQDYVSEKFYDAMISGSVPVYIGAPNIDEFAPADNSFINALDFSGPEQLAKHLNTLYRDTEAYNQLLNWKEQPLRPSFLQKVKPHRHNSLCRLCLYYKKLLCKKTSRIDNVNTFS